MGRERAWAVNHLRTLCIVESSGEVISLAIKLRVRCDKKFSLIDQPWDPLVIVCLVFIHYWFTLEDETMWHVSRCRHRHWCMSEGANRLIYSLRFARFIADVMKKFHHRRIRDISRSTDCSNMKYNKKLPESNFYYIIADDASKDFQYACSRRVPNPIPYGKSDRWKFFTWWYIVSSA